MKIHPSVVVGVGTSGAYVISNIERILYEVLGDTKLDLFRLLVVETDHTTLETDNAPGGRLSQMVDAFETDIGQAIKNLTHFLAADFDWCPKDLSLGSGRGAGNVRAGGRLMFHSKFPAIHAALQRSMHMASEQVGRNATTAAVQSLFRSRGLEPPQDILDPGKSVVYVTGTLAGGTCSGMCVDLGYAIRQIDPHAERVGIFFMPDTNAPETFRQNAWAALKDLEYFTDFPSKFKGVWYSEQRTPFRYTGGDKKPYDQIYLISSTNQASQTRLLYQSSMQSPLLVMVANMLAADLLGLYGLRAGKLVNLNQHVQGAEKRRTFLNFNLRGISYPKYEISEAAACKVVDGTICTNWLSTAHYITRVGVQSNIMDDNERAKGRDLWNEKFNSAWSGAGPSVDLADLGKQLIDGNMDHPAKTLKHQFTGNVQNTIYSKVAQTMSSRLNEIKKFIHEGLRERTAHTMNLRCAELFLEGVKSELELTARYWEALGVPARSNSPGWSALANNAVDDLLALRASTSARAAIASTAVIHDGLGEIRTRLSMHLMTGVLQDVSLWIDAECREWLLNLRAMLQQVQVIASERSNQIVQRLQDNLSGPVLRVSRSKDEDFKVEVDRLASGQNNAMQLPFLEIFEAIGGAEASRASRLFLRLKNEVQPELLRALVARGSVDISNQLRNQDRISQGAIYLQQTLDMSLATDPGLQKAPTAVPSFIIAKDVVTASNLASIIQQVHIPGLPQMEYKALPMFDHMAIFYQEGADFEPDHLVGAETFRADYEQRMKQRADYLDPLGYMKRPKAGEDAQHA
jgi:hypothetical protein